jgi:hypothetical protein
VRVVAQQHELRPSRRPEDVRVFFKGSFGFFEKTRAKREFACDSVTLLRHSELVPDRTGGSPPTDRAMVPLAVLTTEEFPRDDERSKIEAEGFVAVLGIGPQEHDLFRVVPRESSIDRGLARLRELAAGLGADAVVEVFMTTYAEHQMWEGTAVSLDPVSTRSPLYASVRLLDFRLRDVRFHGVAVAYE